MSENWKDASDVIVAEFEHDVVTVQVVARKNPDGDGLQVSAEIDWDYDYDPYGEPDSELQAAGELLYPYLKDWRRALVLIEKQPDLELGGQGLRDQMAQIDNFIRELKARNFGLM